MAKAQRPGFNAITVWMVVFVGLWLTATVFLVILYTGQEELRSHADRLEEDRAQLVSDSERRSIALFQQARAGGPTVVGLLEGARADTAELATGVAGDDAAAIQNKLDEFLRMIQSDRIVADPDRFDGLSYHEALTMLYQAYSADHGLRMDAEQRLAELEAEVDRLALASTQIKDDLDARAQGFSDQFQEVEADRDRYRNERDAHVVQLEKDFETRRGQHDADLTRARQRNAALEEQVQRLGDRVSTFGKKFGELLPGPEEFATARQPDGRILTAVPGDAVVYVDRGRAHRLTRGLRFAVYSADGGIPRDGRAKAQIEVASISEASAECEIKHVEPGEFITEGDLIANPIYDANRTVSFVVLGQFDLDHNGVPEPTSAAVIEAMITDWGATISSELTALTDFVVVGVAPRRPRPVRDQAPEQVARHNAMQQVYDAYLATIRAAKDLSIPVLTQEVFLNFLGYSNSSARR